MSEKISKLVGLSLPIETYNAIIAQLKPLESVQDFIRALIDEKLKEAQA